LTWFEWEGKKKKTFHSKKCTLVRGRGKNRQKGPLHHAIRRRLKWGGKGSTKGLSLIKGEKRRTKVVTEEKEEKKE